MSKQNQEEVIKNIKTCILSSKGGVPITSLSKDYHMLIGDPLPYRGLGFSNLEDFIRSISDLKLTNDQNGDTIVQTAHNEKNNRLARLVAMQRTSNNARFPKTTRKSIETNSRKPWTRCVPSNNNNNKSLRTPSLLRNLSQPSTSIPKNNSLHRSQSSPGNKSSPHHEESTPNPIPSLLSVDTSGFKPVALKMPNTSVDRRKRSDTNQKKPGSGRINNNEEVIYSPVVCPSIKKPVVPQAEIKATAHITTLKNYAMENNLGDIEFKTIEMITGSTKQYISSITIGNDFKISTYPNGGSTTQEALELASQLAYNTLLTKMSAPAPDLPATESTSEALKRILKILESHPNGVWANKIPDEYASLYGEQLSADWLQQAMDCPQVDPNIISDRQIILALAAEGSVSPKKSQEKTSSLPCSSHTLEVKKSVAKDEDLPAQDEDLPAQVEQNLKDALASDLLQPPHLQLPNEENWDVYVTNANSTTEVWLRLVGDKYSSLYENLATEMELYYLEHRAAASEVNEGCYYALELDDCVHRVQVATVCEDGSVNCFLLDHGQVEKVTISDLKHLEPHFLSLPFQGLQCELQGLESFSEAEGEAVQALLLDTVVGKTFVAQPSSLKVLGATHPVGSVPITLRLFDTSTDEDVDINMQLWSILASQVLVPRLPQEGKVVEVIVSHITQEGQIYVQLQGAVFVTMQDRIASLDPDSLPKNKITQTVKGKLYLALHNDGVWYRAVVVSVSDGMTKVLFVDVGVEVSINVSELIDLEDLPSELSNIPFQAILCRLHHILPCSGARVTDRTIARLATLLPANVPQLLKVVGAASPSNLATVELFRRLEPDNLLVSLNNTLAMDTTLFDMPVSKDGNISDFVKEKENKSPGSMQEILSRTLCQPKVPDIGGYLDVNVTLAASPCNFVVQPWEQGPELEQLMVALQSMYGIGDSSQVQTLTSNDIQEGGVYAALHGDGKWYRVQVNNLLKGDHLTVFFVDFGDHTVISINKLRPLASKFCRLPCQAIKAKLSGIRPRHSDWSVEDCVRFQELVCNRQFVSMVEETGPDLINPSDTVLGLRLIDTSDDKFDVNIGELLVKEQRANFVK